jgi:hypothetical protein
MVYHIGAGKVYRTNFRSLPFGQRYWLATNVATAPSTKLDRKNALAGWNISTGAATLSAITDTSVAVVKVPRQFSKMRSL